MAEAGASESLVSRPEPDGLKAELGPFIRALAGRYFEPVRFPPEAEAELARLNQAGFVVHVMRTTAWVNYLYLAWALAKRGLPPIRAVVNLRRWLTKPWRRAAQRGEFDVRFTYARRAGGSGLVFLKQAAFGSARGRHIREDPFPALVAMARRGEGNVFLVPELFVWEKWSLRLKPGIIDLLFGSPEAPGFLHTLIAFWRNYQRAQFRLGEPIDLKRFIADNPDDSDEVLGRKARSALHHHLARETRAVFGPPFKPADRLLEEVMRDRGLRRSLEEIASASGRKEESVRRQALRDLKSIAARYHPTVVALASPVLSWVFNRIYDGVEVDEAGLERAMKAASRAPLVIVPSHKSHVDYLVMSYVLWARGYSIPVVAAGANLSFWPLGPFLRRGGAFFLRRTFKDDKVYTAAFRAYIKKLVHDGVHQEFFPEGGRSRTGKLLPPKLGMITWEVDAILEGARNDLLFVPVAIDYEKVLESSSYSKELAGGEKKPEDLKALLSAPKVLASRYGRIHLSFDEPISLLEFMSARGLSPKQPIAEEQKRTLVRALGHRIMYGVSRVSTVTPQALVATALLAHRRRGISARALADWVRLLRRIAEEEGARLSRTLEGSPSDPTALGAVGDAMHAFCSDGMVRVHQAKGEPIYQADENRRPELSFYKNTLMNLMAPRSLAANAVLAGGQASPIAQVKGRALFLSRLFKLEFIYRVGATFDLIFEETLASLTRAALVVRDGDSVSVAPDAKDELEFLAGLMRDYLEAYLLATLTLEEVDSGKLDRKDFIKAALETGRAEYLAGRIATSESISRTTLENAAAFLLERRVLLEADKKLSLGPAGDEASRRKLVEDIRRFLTPAAD
ncbi:MAG: 1-acyl-sn-glycerol-3-phosphate acyltransferase [Myxococcales bacterium]|nr:1-acyl-sn-glycerol-3-phosphate acyltransferase [Myxococcales bacterium]